MAIWEAQTPYACGWSFLDDCVPCADKIVADGTAADNTAIFQRAVNVAAEILYALSARQFGLCELTVRPCRIEECGAGEMFGTRWTPLLAGGEWHNVSCASCGDRCSCRKVCDLRLPGPISSVTQIKVDGVVLPPASYRVDDRRTIVRTDDACWPTCQNMAADDTEEGTYSVTYLRGKPLPEAGQNALATLACEIFLDCLGDDCCTLPKRVTNLSRQGVTMAMLDPMDFIPEGKTGLYAVDLWLHSVNPKAKSRGAAILSPDMPRHRRRTFP